MANEWFRLWHDMPNDPKWRTIARASGQSISTVQAVWLQILASASQNSERGTYDVLEEDIASALNESDEAVCAITQAMQGRVLDGKRLTGWERRQPSREDGADGKGKSSGCNYIYYVASTDNDVVKIGISRNPWSRVKDLQTGSASKFVLLATLKTDERNERAIHKFFESSRLNGEWFNRSAALNSLISKTNSKDLITYEQTLTFLSSLPESEFESIPVVGVDTVATTKDKDKEEDKDKDKEEKQTPPNPRRRGNAFDASSIDLPDWLDREDWQGWVADRKARKKPVTQEAAKLQLKQLAELRAEGHQPSAVIANSIASGYQGLFPPRTQTRTKSNGATAHGNFSQQDYHAGVAADGTF
ncbi:GIY-YIG nuclease family protein [Achromobacter piechaudii]|uniref:Bacteriophage T5 Orf172 DNA-binding domain-containing protein n=1 Tax=Achromobacter piechaudii ATCC 43553 TaxID=742159 RepID=D4XAR7_9BURK|nr:GIY-YIG nuclease family protein [Achromobacter piechaudii]EFF76079.1 hypothetical protein HMPREF0004_2564 [Achromobacter piechaudii ATCC 43553]